MKRLTKFHHFMLIALAIIAFDQITKIIAFHTLRDGPAVLFDDWLKLQYETNPGMAFGATIGGRYGKLILTLFRFGAMFAIIMFMRRLFRQNSSKGFLVCLAMILAGAAGNLVDSTFYGIIVPEDLLINRFDPPFALFHGKVIDFIFFDFGWIEIFGSKIHLWPIFNVADSSIFISVIIIIINQKKYFKDSKSKKEEAKDEVAAEANVEASTKENKESEPQPAPTEPTPDAKTDSPAQPSQN